MTPTERATDDAAAAPPAHAAQAAQAAHAARAARALDALWSSVAAEPWAHDFFALVRRVDALRPEAPRTGEAARPQREALRFAQPAELDFAPAPLARLEWRDGQAPRLSVRFFGLLGPQGALPLHLTEYVRERVRQHGDASLAHFLDIFHHRLLTLFYRAWSLSQPVVHRDRPALDRYRAWLGAVAGTPHAERLPADALVHQAALLSARSRHPEALLKVLRQQFGVPVAVTPNVGHWLELERADRSRLGFAGSRLERHAAPAARLGAGAAVGRRVWDRQYRFRLHLGPLDGAAHDRFLPGGAAHAALLDWVELLAGAELQWDLELERAERPEPRLVRGLQAPRLGVGTWIGRASPGPSGDGERRHLRLRPRRSYLHRRAAPAAAARTDPRTPEEHPDG